MMRRIALSALRGAAAAAMIAAPAGLLAAPLVVRSLGPSAKAYPPGRAVGENSPIILKAGDVVTVLAPSGARTLRGPGTFKVASGGTAPAFNPRSRFGAMRGPEVPPSPGLWDVDVSAGGNVCLASAGQALLWRPSAAADATLELVPAAGAAQKVDWAAGRLVQRWPAQLPIADGAEYQLKWAGESEAARLRIKTLAAEDSDPTALARAFIDKGCDAQLDRLLKVAPSEDEGGEPAAN
ncbi:MAG TPA: hypothetical protein VF759_08410 [Allosphingosinicella sp.]|jgi:hypothetical protein